MPLVTTAGDGVQAKPGVRSKACPARLLLQAFETVSRGVSGASACGALVVEKTGLHGPYETAGSPFVAPVLPTSRIARTRQWMVVA